SPDATLERKGSRHPGRASGHRAGVEDVGAARGRVQHRELDVALLRIAHRDAVRVPELPPLALPARRLGMQYLAPPRPLDELHLFERELDVQAARGAERLGWPQP